jgi:hypothetical protein
MKKQGRRERVQGRHGRFENAQRRAAALGLPDYIVRLFGWRRLRGLPAGGVLRPHAD